MAESLKKEILSIQFFGEHLVDRWVITREQLLGALRFQAERNLKFGDIAVKKGMLTRAQTEAIHERQRTGDSNFGATARAMGLLTEAQLDVIATYQKNNNVCLGDALLRLGHITEEVLAREIALYERQQALFVLGDVSVPAVAGARIIQAAVDLTRKMFGRVVGTKLKVGRGVVLDGDEAGAYFATVSVTLTGSFTVELLLSASQPLASCIAAAILREDGSEQPNDLLIDAVKELCNIICGNAAAKLAQDGIRIEISPPSVLPAIPHADGKVVVAFPVRSTSGGIDLRFRVPVAA